MFALTLVKVVGGAILLARLGAPDWALAAWLLAHVRFRLLLPAATKDAN